MQVSWQVDSLSLVIPVHNDELIIRETADRIALAPELAGFRSVRVYFVENGSTDRSLEMCNAAARELSHERFLCKALHEDNAGIGWAYARGVREALQEPEEGHLIVLSASDLPFGFSDIKNYLAFEKRAEKMVVIGSKAHPESRISGWPFSRRLAGSLYCLLRRIILGITTRDTQGVFFLSAGVAAELTGRISSRDFFYSTELVFEASKAGIPVEEIPVRYEGEKRRSSVSLFRHGARMLGSMLKLRCRCRQPAGGEHV